MKKLLCAILSLTMLLTLAAVGTPAALAAEPAVKAADMLGTKDGNVYENEALGMRVEFPENWQILSSEEAMKLLNAGMEILDRDSIAEMLEKNSAVFDLYAMKTDNSGDNLNIQLQNLNALQEAVLTEEKIAAINAGSMEEELERAGFEMTDLRQDTMVFCGSEHPMLAVTMEIQGVSMYSRAVFVKNGNYLATITVSSLDEGRCEEMLGLFEEL